MNTARFLMPIFTLHDFLYLLLDFLLAGSFRGSESDKQTIPEEGEKCVVRRYNVC